MDPCRWRSLVLDSNNILASTFHWQNSTQKEIVGIYSRLCLVDSMKSKCREMSIHHYSMLVTLSLVYYYTFIIQKLNLFGCLELKS